jgi:threonine dehydrogenase-like Zn-dependent dehydrogenase
LASVPRPSGTIFASEFAMRALRIEPSKPDSLSLVNLPEPESNDGDVLVETIAVGICGTDIEIIRGDYGESPPGENYLVIGHESLGRVLESGHSDLRPGDFVVPMVRHPDPVPCPNCAVREWDMCRNGKYTEHGIKQRHGFARDRFRVAADRLVAVDSGLAELGVLLEPASVVAKAWEHIEHIGRRARFEPRSVLVTGAGPIGLLAAMMGRQRGLKVDVIDIVQDGPKPRLVEQLGAVYQNAGVHSLEHTPEIALECTGVAQVVFDVMQVTTPGGIVCLTGVSSGGWKLTIDMGSLNRSMVLENDVVFGSVNANRRHYEAAATALAKADRAWLQSLITRRVPLTDWSTAFHRQPSDVKVILDFNA